MYVAGRLEDVRARVVAEVGYAPQRPVEVVVFDAADVPAGFTFTQPHRPRMLLYPTAPLPGDEVGNFRSWPELLILHEDTHVVHLLRPSRNTPLQFLFDTFNAGGGPISFAPKWVTEGYATVVEGRLTGAGRPNSAARASLLRRLAVAGRLPTYEQLDGDRSEWDGRRYRYLVGSAFLEWAEARAHPGALRDLWARMTAKRVRLFDDAFQGVFGQWPYEAYAIFVAEVTADAVAEERGRPPDPGTLWQDWDWEVGPPAVAPDGDAVAVVRRARRGAPWIEVYDTGPDEEARADWERATLPDRQADPEDVDPVRPPAYERTPRGRRVLGGMQASWVRWIDEDRLLLGGLVRQGDGALSADLFVWRVGGGLRRLTRGEQIRDADPYGDVAYAVRTTGGLSELVSVSLVSGEATSLDVGPPSPTVAYGSPRARRDGGALAYLVNRGSGWTIEQVALRDGVPSGAPAVVPVPLGAEVLGMDWSGDAMVASLGLEGFAELYALEEEGWRRVTQSSGGAFAPAATPDGRAVYYLVPGPDGPDLHLRPLAGDATVEAGDAASAAPAVAPADSPPVVAARYGIGRPSIGVTAGSAFGPGQDDAALGVVATDLIGRYELLGLAQVGAWDVEGWRVAGTWRGSPTPIRLEVARPEGTEVSAALDVMAEGSSAHGRYNARASAAWQGEPAFDVAVGGSQRWWVGGSWLGAGASLGAHGAVTAAPLGRVGGWVGAGTDVVSVIGEAEASRGALRWGGVPELLLPDALATDRVWAPGLSPDAVPSVDGVDRLRLSAALGPVSLFGAQDRTDLGRFTRVGVEGDLALRPLPFLAVSGMEANGGVACVLEAPLQEAPATPCARVADWTAWLSVRVRPGASRRFGP